MCFFQNMLGKLLFNDSHEPQNEIFRYHKKYTSDY